MGWREQQQAVLEVCGKAWDEGAHPRGQPENAGQFGPGGGGQSKPSGKPAKQGSGGKPEARVHSSGKAVASLDKTLSPAHQQAVRGLAKSIAATKGLSSQQRVDYFNATQKVIKNMSPGALARFNAGHDGKPRFYADKGELKRGLAREKGVPDYKGNPAGAYLHTSKQGSLHIDGGRIGEEAENARAANRSVDSHEIYSHEFSHVIDGPRYEISSSPEWQAAWKEELGGGDLTEYAGSKASEGFAEFGRLVLGGEHNMAEVKREYPKCFAVWQKRGLVAPTAKIVKGNRPVGIPEVFAERVEVPGGGHIDTMLEVVKGVWGKLRGRKKSWHAHQQAVLEVCTKAMGGKKAAASGAGHWITIGGKPGKDGKKHGGSPVYIENGRITRGAPSLQGKRIDALKEDSDTTHRQELHRQRGYGRAKWAKKAKKAGVEPEHLHQLAAEMVEHDKQHVESRKKLLKDARETMKRSGYNPGALTTNLRSGRVEDKIPHLDELVDSMQRRYPEQFAGHEGDAEARLIEMLTEGNPEAMSEDAAYEHALEHLEEHGRGGGDELSGEPLWEDEEDDDNPFKTYTPDGEKARRRTRPDPAQGEFFARCERDSGGHCMAESGGGSAPTKPTGSHREQQAQAALSRFANRDQHAHGGGLFGGEDMQARRGFSKLPDGAGIVFTEGEFEGQTGKIVREGNRIVAEVDGRPGNVPISPESIEPLNPAHSWRTEAAYGDVEQKPLFDAGAFLGDRGTEKEKPVQKLKRPAERLKAEDAVKWMDENGHEKGWKKPVLANLGGSKSPVMEMDKVSVFSNPNSAGRGDPMPARPSFALAMSPSAVKAPDGGPLYGGQVFLYQHDGFKYVRLKNPKTKSGAWEMDEAKVKCEALLKVGVDKGKIVPPEPGSPLAAMYARREGAVSEGEAEHPGQETLPTGEPVPAGNHICPRCGGAGLLSQYSHVEGGVCFDCDGAGYQEDKEGKKSWQMQQKAILESWGTKDYRPHHLRFDAHACCFIDEESGKAWDEGVHPRVDSGEHGGEFTSGGGGSGGGETSEKPQTPREKHAAEVARIDAEHAKVMEKHEEAMKEHEAAVEAIDAKHAEEHGAWEKRKTDRESREERIDNVVSFVPGNDAEGDAAFEDAQQHSNQLFPDFTDKPEEWQQTADAITAHAAGFVSDWQAACGPDGVLMGQLRGAGFSEEDTAKLSAISEKALPAISKAAEKVGKAAEAKVKIEQALQAMGGEAPEAPDDLPEEGVTPEMQAAYDKAQAKYEKDSDKWSKLEDKQWDIDSKVSETQSDLQEVYDAHLEKIGKQVIKLQEQGHEVIDKEAEADEEPEDNTSDEYPAEPEEPEEPEYPDEPEEEESDTRWPAKETEGKAWMRQQKAILKAWEESKHPRGQPGNAGQFGPGSGGESSEEEESKSELIRDLLKEIQIVPEDRGGVSIGVLAQEYGRERVHEALLQLRRERKVRLIAAGSPVSGWAEEEGVDVSDYIHSHNEFFISVALRSEEKAWESGKHPRGGDSKNPGRFSSGAGSGTVDEPTKRPEPSAIPPTRATGGSVHLQPHESQTPKAPHPSSTADRSPLHQTMEKAPLKRADVLEGGANATSLLTLEDGTKAVFKTPAGESRDAGRSGVPFGTQYRREIAASRIADALGFGDLVPATTVRDQGGDVGSVQAFVADAYNTSEVDEPFDGGEDAARAAVFDYLVGHLDRHQGNWLLKDGKIALIDNGLSFPDAYHTDDFFNMEFWKHTQQEDLPMPDVSALEGKWPAVEKELRDSGIEDAAIGLARQRFDAVVDGGKEYVSELPTLLGEEGGPTLGDMAQYYSRGARKDRHNAMVAEKERVFLEERKRAREARRAAKMWDESLHPREHGKFAEKEGGSDSDKKTPSAETYRAYNDLINNLSGQQDALSEKILRSRSMAEKENLRAEREKIRIQERSAKQHFFDSLETPTITPSSLAHAGVTMKLLGEREDTGDDVFLVRDRDGSFWPATPSAVFLRDNFFHGPIPGYDSEQDMEDYREERREVTEIFNDWSDDPQQQKKVIKLAGGTERAFHQLEAPEHRVFIHRFGESDGRRIDPGDPGHAEIQPVVKDINDDWGLMYDPEKDRYSVVNLGKLAEKEEKYQAFVARRAAAKGSG